MIWPFRRKQRIEQRAGGGYYDMAIAERWAAISGRSGVAELTATAQACIGLWEAGFSLADVSGTDLIDRASLALIGRGLALKGNAVLWIRDDGLVPCIDWDVGTRDSRPRSYRVSVPEVSGGRNMTLLAGEVLHFSIGATMDAPWLGRAPLQRASLTGDMLAAVETALTEVFTNAPLGSQIVPFPEASGVDLDKIGQSFTGRRGRVLMRESVNVSAAGGPAPQTDWRPADTTPDLEKAMTAETLDRARHAVSAAFGVLPSWLAADGQGPAIREAQRHLCQFVLQPLAAVMAQEASRKLGGDVWIDVLRPMQAYDSGGRARAFSAVIDALGRAKEAGLAPNEVQEALKLVDWQP